MMGKQSGQIQMVILDIVPAANNRNIFSVTPRNKMKAVALMLKAIHEVSAK